jgi:hypothetical protein
MPFKDFSELVEPLVLPINGKQYTIPPVSMVDGIRFNTAADPNAAEGTEVILDPEFFEMFLGDTYRQMLADGVPGIAITRAAMTALADFQRGRTVAEVMWETGADPKALSEYLTANLPNRAARRQGSKGSGVAKSTRTRASSSGTKRRAEPSQT